MESIFAGGRRNALLLAAAVFATATLSILLTRDHTEISAVWAANAIVVAALLHSDRRRWPLLLIADYLANGAANLATGNGWVIAVFCSAANLVEILVCAWMLEPGFIGSFDKARTSRLGKLLLAALVGSLCSAAIATLVMWLHNGVSPGQLFVSWFISDALGLLIFLPAVVVLLAGTTRDALRGPLSNVQAGLVWLAFAAALGVIFGQSELGLLPAAPMLLIAAAFVFQPSGAALALTLIACTAIAATALGSGPVDLIEGATTARLHNLQVLLALLAFSGMPVALVLARRRAVEASLAEARDDAVAAHAALSVSEGRLEAIAAAARDLIVRYDRDSTMTYASPASLQMLGYTPEELVGRRMEEFLHPDDVARGGAELAAIVKAGPDAPSVRMRLRARHKDGRWRWIEGYPRARFDAETGQVTAVYDVLRDITEQHALAEALVTARERAETAAQSKSDFLANMSHELRTPLNSVVGFSKLLAQSRDLNPRDQRFAALIESASRATVSIVNDVLDISALERRGLVVRRQPFSLTNVLRSAVDLSTPLAEAKGLVLDLRVDEAVAPGLSGDADRVRQILLNLISNGIKFTASGGVHVTAEVVQGNSSEQAVRIRVTDTGVGIPAEHQALIFQRFAQLADFAGRQAPGTGLGLAITRALVDLMGGTIHVTSAPGGGSTFEVNLRFPVRAQAGEPAEAEPPPTPAGRILVVDDVDLNRELAQYILGQAGHVVETAASGEEAIAACARQVFDIVFMDVRMPGMDGMEATRAIRNGGGGCATAPIIALTAAALPEQITACLNAGMDGHLAKPLDADGLLASVAQWTGATRAGLAVRERAIQADLGRRFLERLEAERQVLAVALGAHVLPSGIESLAHRLAGSAGSFGHHRVGELAAALETVIQQQGELWREPLLALIEAIEVETAAAARPAA